MYIFFFFDVTYADVLEVPANFLNVDAPIKCHPTASEEPEADLNW